MTQAWIGPEISTTVRSETEELGSEKSPSNGSLQARALRTATRWFPDTSTQLLTRVFLTPRTRRPALDLGAARELGIVSGKHPIRVGLWGKGPRVLLAHGWGGSAEQLRTLRDDLVASGFTAVSFDAPGHGGTPSATSSLPEFRAAIAAIAERLGPLHALVGHSLGASAAALYAETISAHQPAPGLVLIAPLPGFEFAMDHFTRLFPLDAVARERLICSIEQRVATDRGAMELQKLVPRAPSLFVHDAGDRSIPLRYSRALAASWPRSRLIETNGLGHNRILQDATVTRAIVDFVQQLPQTRGSALDRQLRALDEAWPD